MIKDISIEFNLSVNDINFDLVIKSKDLKDKPYSCYLRFPDHQNREKVISAFKDFLPNKENSIIDRLIKNQECGTSVECLHVETSTKNLIEWIIY